MATPTAIAGYLVLFVALGLFFLLIHLFIGRFLRPANPHQEKLEVYECGEPTIGTSFVQYDLRFYVVALVFIVFDVEVAFLFPLGTVFGKATNLSDSRVIAAVESADGRTQLSPVAGAAFGQMGIEGPVLDESSDPARADAALRGAVRDVAIFSFWAINVFFFVLLVGFAYEWKTGAFDWVRALGHERPSRYRRELPPWFREEAPTLTASA